MLHRKRKIWNECEDYLNKNNILFNNENERIIFIDKILKQYLDFGKNISFLIEKEIYPGFLSKLEKDDKKILINEIVDEVEELPIQEIEELPIIDITESSSNIDLETVVELPKKKGRRPNK